MQMLLFTPFSRSEEQRAEGCQQISGTKQLPCTAAQPIGGLKQTGYHFANRSISILMECSGKISAVKTKEETHQDSHLSLLEILFRGQLLKAHLLLSPSKTAGTDRWLESSSQPHLNCRCAAMRGVTPWSHTDHSCGPGCVLFPVRPKAR